MKFAILPLMLLAFAGNICGADGMSIATVDVRKIFENWEYSIQSQEKFEKRREVTERASNDRLAVINQLHMELNEVHYNYQAKELSMTDEKKKEMEAKYNSLKREAQALERDRSAFLQKTMRALRNDMSSDARLILSSITEAIQAYAREQNYNMVIEMGGHTNRSLPLFVHLEKAVDITDVIIKQLNAAEGN